MIYCVFCLIRKEEREREMRTERKSLNQSQINIVVNSVQSISMPINLECVSGNRSVCIYVLSLEAEHCPPLTDAEYN